MFKAKAAFSGFSVDALAKAKEFYTETLGLKVDDEGVGLRIHLPGSGAVFAYPKADHQPGIFRGRAQHMGPDSAWFKDWRVEK